MTRFDKLIKSMEAFATDLIAGHDIKMMEVKELKAKAETMEYVALKLKSVLDSFKQKQD